jgi:lipopolysaccharide/colanic/teichoic acid biosynthesis glycosyltransferase
MTRRGKLRTGAWAGRRRWTRIDLGMKRATDVVGAVVALVLCLPLLVVVSLAILIESPGPLLYRANRIGQGGRPLKMLKFRKMRRAAGGPPLTARDDARLTRVGAFLARTRLDELPQLWQVLRGEMSLVGPRPEDPAFVARRPVEYEEILQIRPGIAGLSQLAFANERSILDPDDPVSDYADRILPQKCHLDRLYVRRRNMAMDTRILMWTFLAVCLGCPVAVHRDTGAMSRRRRPGTGTTPVLSRSDT